MLSISDVKGKCLKRFRLILALGTGLCFIVNVGFTNSVGSLPKSIAILAENF